MEATIRQAGAADGEAVVRLVSALLAELGGRSLDAVRSREVFARLVRDPDAGFVSLAETAEGAIGVCTVSHAIALRSLGRYSIVQETYVVPAARASSVGTQLVTHALGAATQGGSRFVELGTPPGGERQIAFYLRMGFLVVGERLRWHPAS